MFNNDTVDGSFGVTSRIFLNEITPSGQSVGTLAIPQNELVTSFSSKSELALNLSPDGSTVSFMGYIAKADDVDVSNSNTPGVIDPTNPVPSAFYRAAAQITGESFGVANPDTLYVADEGNGTATFSGGQYTAAASQTTAGLQKWVFDGTEWKLAYTLAAGLNLGQPYTVAGYPAGTNAATGLPWSPATDGLRNITGRVNRGGTVSIWAITSTVSGSGDQGADPNKLVEITDPLGATAPAAGESFRTLRTAAFAGVIRGVSFTPGSR